MSKSSPAVAEASQLLAEGRGESAVQILVQASQAGDGDALYTLGLWHVYGQPVRRDFAIARHLFGQAAQLGNSKAISTYSVFASLGAGGIPPNWKEAIAVLRSKSDVDDVAAAQLALLSQMPLDEDGEPHDKPAVRTLAQNPSIRVVTGLFTAAECNHLMQLAKPLLAPSLIADPKTGNLAQHPIRTSEGAVLGPIQQDLVLEAMNRRIAAVTGTRVEQGEPATILRYAPGQQYRLHHDCLPAEPNQRIVTAIIYLNDDYLGGSTIFPNAGVEYKGRTGDLILFQNTTRDGRPDEASRHAGQPVESGEKWVCTRWIRARNFDPWGMRG